jgi:hypothetical protein
MASSGDHSRGFVAGRTGSTRNSSSSSRSSQVGEDNLHESAMRDRSRRQDEGKEILAMGNPLETFPTRPALEAPRADARRSKGEGAMNLVSSQHSPSIISSGSDDSASALLPPLSLSPALPVENWSLPPVNSSFIPQLELQHPSRQERAPLREREIFQQRQHERRLTDLSLLSALTDPFHESSSSVALPPPPKAPRHPNPSGNDAAAAAAGGNNPRPATAASNPRQHSMGGGRPGFFPTAHPNINPGEGGFEGWAALAGTDALDAVASPELILLGEASTSGGTKSSTNGAAIGDDGGNRRSYVLNDLLESTKEGWDDTAVVRNYDGPRRKMGSNNSAVVPLVSDELIANLEEEEVDDAAASDAALHHSRLLPTPAGGASAAAGGRKPAVTLRDLTKRLVESNRHASTRLLSNSADNTQKNRVYGTAAALFPSSMSRILSHSESSEDIEEGRHRSGRDGEGEMIQNNFFRVFQLLGRRAKADVVYFVDFLVPRKQSMWKAFAKLISYVIIPSLLAASLVFYGFGNLPTGTADIPCEILEAGVTSSAPSSAPAVIPTSNGVILGFTIWNRDGECVIESKSLAQASMSWWFLFICRQSVTLGLAGILQVIVIDFCTLRTRFFPGVFGTTVSLGIAQSKGWPFTLFAWAIVDIMVLFGPRQFARHWLFWQTLVAMMNPVNPSGNVTNSPTYKLTIYVAILLSIAVTIKRTVIGVFLGKRVVSKCTVSSLGLLLSIIVSPSRVDLQQKTTVGNCRSSFRR